MPLVRQLADSGKKVSSISSCTTSATRWPRGVESVAKLGATFLTVHAYPQTMEGGGRGEGRTNLKILAVTG